MLEDIKNGKGNHGIKKRARLRLALLFNSQPKLEGVGQMNNNTCSYCGSSLGSPATPIDKVYCGFCEMFVEVAKDGERMERYIKKEFVEYDLVHKPTVVLVEMHTKTLLELLKFMREERREYFNTMRILKKGASDNPEFQNAEKESSDMYEFITKKCFVVENILRDRMGYIPQKITDNLILAYNQRCSDPYNERKMTINRPERTIEKGEGISR